ncbi:MAG: NAD(P)H-hydrate dehydratase [Bacteroidia bacterium]
MIPVLTSEQIRLQDQLTIESEPISSLDLMERAARVLSDALTSYMSFDTALIFCGPGNNGGDGLAMARMLSEAGKTIRVCIPTSNSSKDFQANLDRLPSTVERVDFNSIVPEGELIIDAIFGTGLSREVDGIYKDWISWINTQACKVVAVDMPSGMPDTPQWALAIENCISAEKVLTLQFPKLSLLLPYCDGFAESIEILDIGLKEFEGQSNFQFVESSDISSLLKHRKRFTHKYKEGSALLVGGSKGKTGSIVLASEAAFRAGAGLVNAHVPSCVLSGLQQYLPEVMYSVSGENILLSFPSDVNKVSAIGIGPGLGLEKELTVVLNSAMNADIPLVMDADALRLLSEHSLFHELPNGCILTPHEGEFKAMVGPWQDESEKLGKLMNFSNQYNVVTILKGAYTLICDGNNIFFNSSGHPAMATAGSGDVLLGILTSLLAQSYKPLSAALAGVYLHGFAAEIFLKNNKSATLMASDISKSLGSAMALI